VEQALDDTQVIDLDAAEDDLTYKVLTNVETSVNWETEVVPTLGSLCAQFCLLEMMYSFVWLQAI